MGTKRVAIINNDASANRALGRLLRCAGFEPHGFDCAESFIANSARESFVCVVVDTQLSDASGLDLHQYLLAQGRQIPVIFIIAGDDPNYRAESLRGCSVFRKTDRGALIVEALRRATAMYGAG
ncbi:MAG: response regulator [Gammaproteobacteria bacterium]|nr:response regulator [Gammaproteobacteria bacterium]